MKVILTDTNEVKEVKPGYGRNFLIPEGKAILATKQALKELEKTKQSEVAKLKDLIKDLQKVQLTIPAKVGEKGKLFGAVTVSNIVASFKDEGYDIDPKWLDTAKSIKSTGKHKITVTPAEGHSASVVLEVIEDKEK